MRQLRAWLLLIAMVALVVLAGVGVVSLVLPRYRYAPLESHTSEDLGYERTFDKKIMNIALFGIDPREPNSFSGLSDCIMIVSVNTETKQVKLLSIMRDSLVRTEKNGKKSFGKINAVYQRGAAQSIRAINQNFGTDISDYVTVNFFGLAKIIDALGGVDITLTDEEIADLGPKRPTINFYIGEICAGLGVDPKDYYLIRYAARGRRAGRGVFPHPVCAQHVGRQRRFRPHRSAALCAGAAVHRGKDHAEKPLPVADQDRAAVYRNVADLR